MNSKRRDRSLRRSLASGTGPLQVRMEVSGVVVRLQQPTLFIRFGTCNSDYVWTAARDSFMGVEAQVNCLRLPVSRSICVESVGACNLIWYQN